MINKYLTSCVLNVAPYSNLKHRKMHYISLIVIFFCFPITDLIVLPSYSSMLPQNKILVGFELYRLIIKDFLFFKLG